MLLLQVHATVAACPVAANYYSTAGVATSHPTALANSPPSFSSPVQIVVASISLSPHPQLPSLRRLILSDPHVS